MKWINKGHEFDAIGHLLNNKKRMFIYGAGILGVELYNLINSMKEYLHWDIVFIDSDKNKQQHSVGGIVVLSPDELSVVNVDDSFVVVCNFHEKHQREMFDTIGRYGFIEMKNAFEHDFFLYKYLSIHFIYNLDKVYFSSLNIVPSTFCNLNCNGCLNFTQFIKNHTTYSLDSLKTDCDALFNAIDLIGRFQVTGGEPFLYRNVDELLSHIHNNYAKKIIRFEIVTNGTIIPSDKLCVSLKENDVFVFLDDYRQFVPLAKKNYAAVKEKFDRFQVTYQENFVPQWFDLQPLQPLKELTETELMNFFNACDCPWATVWNKSLSSCNYSLYAAKADLVEFDSDNYFDLTKEHTPVWKKELVEFRLRYNNKGYVELCRQCSGFSKINNNTLVPAQQIQRININNE